MWSIGCILAELLFLSIKNKTKNNKDHTVLFKGKSCYPVSRDPENPDETTPDD
jgi:hypothetical protein